MSNRDLSVPNQPLPFQPTTAAERIAALDILRGFALGGVLLAYTLWNLGNPPEATYSQWERTLNTVLAAVVDTKCYTLLAFLFGLGFALQLTRAEAHGSNLVPAYCRRLLALLLIGATHAVLLRNGDILVPYATMGFVLLLFRHASNRMLVLAGLCGLLYPYVARSAWEWAGLPFPARPEGEGLSYFADNFAWVRYWYSTGITFWPGSLPMFVFGLYVGRRRFFENLAAQRKPLRGWLLWGLSVSVLAYASRSWVLAHGANDLDAFACRVILGLLWSAHAWGLAAFYATALALLSQRPGWQRRLSPLGAVGRMALSNYLSQAALIVPVCLGFRLFDRVTPRLGILLALAVWTIQVPASVWWLSHFRFGPAEWVWRSLTYGRPQPLRLRVEPSTSFQTDAARAKLL